MNKLSDEMRFRQLGISEGTIFEIKELVGYYVLDLNEQAVYEANQYGKKIVKVSGLYQSLLNGVWHKKIHG